MNGSFSSSAGLGVAPIASPDDGSALSNATCPDTFAAGLGRFLLFGFYGQLAYTVIELGIAASTHGQNEAPVSVRWQLLFLLLPIFCAIWGSIKGRAEGLSKVTHPLAIASLFVAIGFLGLFNLLVLFATMMAGYC